MTIIIPVHRASLLSAPRAGQQPGQLVSITNHSDDDDDDDTTNARFASPPWRPMGFSGRIRPLRQGPGGIRTEPFMMQCVKCPPLRNATFVGGVDYHTWVEGGSTNLCSFFVSSDAWLFPERTSQQRRIDGKSPPRMVCVCVCTWLLVQRLRPLSGFSLFLDGSLVVKPRARTA
jgi:hypothetical protein